MLQCKHHAKPVSTQSVQEVLAPEHTYTADYAAVVSDGRCTEATEKLARETEVALLSMEQLSRLEEIF